MSAAAAAATAAATTATVVFGLSVLVDLTMLPVVVVFFLLALVLVPSVSLGQLLAHRLPRECWDHRWQQC